MSTTSHTPDPTAVLDTAAKLFRVMRKAGASFSCFNLPLQDMTARRNLVEFLRLGCPKVASTVKTFSSLDLATIILESRFITPYEVATAHGLVYPEEQLEEYDRRLPWPEVIAWCRANDYMLLPNPPEPMSFMQIHDLNRELFYPGGKWSAPEDSILHQEKTRVASWLAIRTKVVPDSWCKEWQQKLQLLSQVERVANLAELAWALTTYKKVRNVDLMTNGQPALTSGVDPDCHMAIKYDASNAGLVIERYCDVRAHGLISARQAA